MKTEFTYEEVENYFDNLSPAEKVLISLNMKMAIDYILESHFEEHKTMSLAELVAFVAVDHSDRMDDLLMKEIKSEGV